MRRYVARRLRGDIDDVVEDVFVTAWQRRTKIPLNRDEQLVWLYATGRRKIANLIRLRGRRDRFHSSIERVVPTETTEDGAAVAVTIVHTALAKMKMPQREILLLKEWDGLTLDQVAGVLEISPSAAGKRLAAARAEFRRHCESRLAS